MAENVKIVQIDVPCHDFLPHNDQQSVLRIPCHDRLAENTQNWLQRHSLPRPSPCYHAPKPKKPRISCHTHCIYARIWRNSAAGNDGKPHIVILCHTLWQRMPTAIHTPFSATTIAGTRHPESTPMPRPLSEGIPTGGNQNQLHTYRDTHTSPYIFPIHSTFRIRSH